MTADNRDWSTFPQPDDIFARPLDAAVDRILEQLAAPSVDEPALAFIVHEGLDLSARRAELAQCLGWVRQVYLQQEYPEWLARQTEESSPWRPPRRMTRLAHDPYDEWQPNRAHEDRQWDDAFGKPFVRAAPKDSSETQPTKERWVRMRKPSAFGVANPGAPLGRGPLVWIYHIVKEWWWRNVDPVFRPKFNRDEMQSEQGQVAMMNPAARFLLLFAHEVDFHYTSQHCELVALEEGRYQRQGKKADAMVKKSARARRRYLKTKAEEKARNEAVARPPS